MKTYTIARVRASDTRTGRAWIELQNGTLINLPNLGEVDTTDASGQLIAIDLNDGEVLYAPSDAVWPRPLKITAILRQAGERFAVLDIAGSTRVTETSAISAPAVGETYFFEDQDQTWHPIAITEADNAATDEIDESSINIESFTPDDNALRNYGGMKADIEHLLRLITVSHLQHSSSPGMSTFDKPPAGAIFFGPPGTGKTHLARVLARSIGATLITVNGPELLDKWMGSTEKALRTLFARASEQVRPILFIDEFDTIGSRRGPEVHEAINRQVGQLLTLMDGVKATAGPFVIAATNRLEDVDPAFLRPGRFDFPLEFRLPGIDDRRDVIIAHATDVIELPENALAWLSENTNAWSPAELNLIWTEAQGRKTLSGRSSVALEDVYFGFLRAREQHSLLERTREDRTVKDVAK